MWDGMGEYAADAVQPILRDALATIDPTQAWPWVARAIFHYESERKISESFTPSEPNADILTNHICDQADALYNSLIGLAYLTIRPPEEVGKQHSEKAHAVQRALRTYFGGATSTGVEYSNFVNGLKAVSAASFFTWHACCN